MFVGSEKKLLDNLKIGGAGCISATTNFTGSLAKKVYDDFKKKGASSENEKLKEEVRTSQIAVQENKHKAEQQQKQIDNLTNNLQRIKRIGMLEVRNKDKNIIMARVAGTASSSSKYIKVPNIKYNGYFSSNIGRVYCRGNCLEMD